MTLFGVRAGVWLALATLSGGGLALGLALAGGSDGGADAPAPPAPRIALRPELAARADAGRGTRIRVGALELGGRPAPASAVANAPAPAFAGPVANAPTPAAAGTPARAQAGAAGDAAPSVAAAPAALAAARPPSRPRPGEVLSLERDALRSLSALPREDADALAARIEAEVAALEPEPGESPSALEERREDARGRLVSDELLLRARLAELYAQQVYPYGFPADRIVAPMERQWIELLPAVDRAEALRRLAESGPPGAPQPRFESLESGLVYEGGPGL